jgi:hypothetical protein
MTYFHDDISVYPHWFSLSRGKGDRWGDVMAWAYENLGEDLNELRWIMPQYGRIAIKNDEAAFIFRMWWC